MRGQRGAGELGEVAPPRRRWMRHATLAAEAGQAVLHVGGVAGLAFLAVADDVDAGVDLLLHGLGDGARTRAWNAASSTGLPPARQRIISMRSAGRGRVPVWVVRMRSVLRFMVPSSERPRPEGGRLVRALSARRQEVHST